MTKQIKNFLINLAIAAVFMAPAVMAPIEEQALTQEASQQR